MPTTRFKQFPLTQQRLFVASVVLGVLLLISAVVGAGILVGWWLTPAPSNAFEAQARSIQIELDKKSTTNDQRDQLLLDQIALYISAKDVNRAADLLKKLDPTLKSTVRAQYLDGSIKVEQNRLPEAITLLKDALSRTQGNMALQRDINETLAEAYLKQGDKRASLESLLAAATAPPASTVLLVQAGDLAFELAKYDEAARAYALALSYDSALAKARQGIIKVRAENREAVEKAFALVKKKGSGK